MDFFLLCLFVLELNMKMKFEGRMIFVEMFIMNDINRNLFLLFNMI